MTAEMILSNARMVLADEVVHGTLQVSGGRIADFDGGGTALPGTQDLDGDYLMPGLVELHTDNLERHVQPRPKVHWPTSSALLAHDAQVVAAGLTTVLDAIAVGGTLREDIRDHLVRTSAAAPRSFRAAGLPPAAPHPPLTHAPP